jgi:hypothetical protein
MIVNYELRITADAVINCQLLIVNCQLRLTRLLIVNC